MAWYHYRGYYDSPWPRYVSVAEKKRKIRSKIKSLAKKGKSLSPIQLNDRKIAGTFWGKAWCANLEAYSDFSNRLPRGRSYLRNGAVIDLKIAPGKITALVSGTSLYTVTIKIRTLDPKPWKAIVRECSGKIDSLVELLQGRLSKSIMEIVTRKEKGLFRSEEHTSELQSQ